MGYEYPTYRLEMQMAEGEISWETTKEILEEWMPTPEGETLERFPFCGPVEASVWSASIPQEVRQEKVIELGDILRRRYPHLTVRMYPSSAGQMDVQDAEDILASKEPNIRRGPLN